MIKTGLIFSVIFLIAVGFFITPLSFAQSSDDLEKERLQLEKERRIYDESFQNLQQQINALSTTITQLQNSGVDDDKLEEIEEQLEELHDDLSKLQETEPSLLERENSFKEKSPALQNTLTSEESESTSIPPWFKSNAKWWNEGLISDGDIINALESLIIQDIIPLDKFVKESSRLEHTAGVSPGGTFVNTSDKGKIPSYQKDVFGYWSNGQVSDSEIVDSIGHLMSQGIINSAKIQGEIAERQAKFDQKMKDLDSFLDSDLPVSNEFKDEFGFKTVENSDGSKTITSDKDDVTTIIYPDGSRVSHFPDNYDYEDSNRVSGVIGDLFSGLPAAEKKFKITKVYTDPDGNRAFYENENPSLVITKNDQKAMFDYSLKSYDDFENTNSGSGMQPLTQITALVIDGIYFPLSQFTMWKWTGECDDAWHYHTPTTQAIAIDGITGITDPDQENCGFGKVGEVQVSTTFMSQDQIEKFRDRTDSDPLENEAMTGGSDDGAAPVNVNPGPVSIEESEDLPFETSDVSDAAFDSFVDSDGDGISDDIDAHPDKYSDELTTENGEGLPAKIIDRNGNTIKIHSGAEGVLSIEVGGYDWDDSKPVLVEIMGVELELEPGTILDVSFF